MCCLCPGWAGASCCPWLCSFLGTIVLGLAWVRPGKTWQSGNFLFLGKIISRGDAFLALSPPWVQVPARRTLALMGVSIPWVPTLGALRGWIQLRATGLCAAAGVTKLFRAGVSSPLQVAPLGQAASLSLVLVPGVEQEDFHCC